MKTTDNENFILENFRMVSKRETLLLGNVFTCAKIRASLVNYFKRTHWIDSSAKNAPPPDFYNNKLKIMMDVMRIDDNAYVDKNGKVQNPIAKKETEYLKQYFGHDYKTVRNDISCHIVVSSGLPTHQDHNFARYFDNFKRVFEKHNRKIDNYKKNHPGYKTIFFIHDESTGYIEVEDKKFIKETPLQGEVSRGRPHFPFSDKRFLDVIKESQVDFVVWYMPYKLIRLQNGQIFPHPKCAIIERANIPKNAYQIYNTELIMSSEI